jgi:hypothetical protein
MRLSLVMYTSFCTSLALFCHAAVTPLASLPSASAATPPALTLPSTTPATAIHVITQIKATLNSLSTAKNSQPFITTLTEQLLALNTAITSLTTADQQAVQNYVLQLTSTSLTPVQNTQLLQTMFQQLQTQLQTKTPPQSSKTSTSTPASAAPHTTAASKSATSTSSVAPVSNKQAA